MSGGPGEDARNPDLRCARRRAPCGHRQAEHGPTRCFGVSVHSGGVGECFCRGFMPPPDSTPPGRQQEEP